MFSYARVFYFLRQASICFSSVHVSSSKYVKLKNINPPSTYGTVLRGHFHFPAANLTVLPWVGGNKKRLCTCYSKYVTCVHGDYRQILLAEKERDIADMTMARELEEKEAHLNMQRIEGEQTLRFTALCTVDIAATSTVANSVQTNSSCVAETVLVLSFLLRNFVVPWSCTSIVTSS